MGETILNFLIDKYPYGIWIIIGGFVSWMLFKILHDVRKAKIKADSAHKKINKLPCEIHNNNHAELKETFISNITEVKTSILYIKETLETINKNNKCISGIISPYSERKSPLSITKKGYELVDRLKIYDMIDSVKKP